MNSKQEQMHMQLILSGPQGAIPNHYSWQGANTSHAHASANYNRNTIILSQGHAFRVHTHASNVRLLFIATGCHKSYLQVQNLHLVIILTETKVSTTHAQASINQKILVRTWLYWPGWVLSSVYLKNSAWALPSPEDWSAGPQSKHPRLPCVCPART